jgi:hypothetical protein
MGAKRKSQTFQKGTYLGSQKKNTILITKPKNYINNKGNVCPKTGHESLD